MPELMWIPPGIWMILAFVATLVGLLLEGRVADPIRLAPVIALALGLLPVGWLVSALRSPVNIAITATSEALRLQVTGPIWAARRAAEAWPATESWEDGTLSIPWTHAAFAKLRAPQVTHFGQGRLRFGRAVQLGVWADPGEGLVFLTRCRERCLTRLGDGPGVHRELARLRRATEHQREPDHGTQPH